MENSEKVMSLIDKGKKGLFNLIFSRLGLIVLLLLIKIWFVVSLLLDFKEYSPYYFTVNAALSIGISFFIINSKDIDPTSKITWLVMISAMPMLLLPMIIGKCSVMRYEEIKIFILMYPLYVVASAILAWICYRQRPEMTAILIALMLLTHVAMWMLPGAV